MQSESSGVAHDATKRRWAPQTTRDTPKGVQNPSINGTEVVSAVFYLTAIMSLKILICNTFVTRYLNLSNFCILLENFVSTSRNFSASVQVLTLRCIHFDRLTQFDGGYISTNLANF